jgi:hypothetical protein
MNAQHFRSSVTSTFQAIGLLLIASLLLLARCGSSDRLLATPPAPEITDKPALATEITSASFRYRDRSPGASFKCALDGARLSACPAAGVTYARLTAGRHTFRVVAQEGRLLSDPASWAWHIGSTGSTPPTNQAARWRSSAQFVGGSAGMGGAFSVHGAAVGPLAPGIEQPIDMSFANPLGVSLTVRSVTISVGPTTTEKGQPNLGCPGARNLVVLHTLEWEPQLRPYATTTLSELGVPRVAWPLIMMPNLPVNQDACKNTAFALSYRATATSP